MSESKESQEDLILTSARNAFAKFGYEKTTMKDIARGAKLKKPSLYYYFNSKDEIFIAVVKRESRELLTAMENATLAEKSTEDMFRAFFFARYRFFKEKKNLYSISQENLEEMRPFVLKAREEFLELEIKSLSKILEKGVEEGSFDIDDPKLVAMLAIASLQGIDSMFLNRGMEDNIEQGLELMMTIFFRGVRKESTK
jgi:AcrR family transcriptional regulator